MLAIVDTETTGPEPKTDHIVEVGSIKIDGDNITGAFSRLFKPPVPIPFEAMAVHHITEEDVQDLGPCSESISDIEAYMSDVDTIVAHNLKFDGTLLKREFPGVFERFAEDEKGCICTLKVARHLWPTLPSHRLHALMYRFGLASGKDGQAHRADFDCLVTWKLLKHQVECVIKNQENSDKSYDALAELAKLTRTPVLLHHLSFGKHKDVPLERVDKNYLVWLSRQEWVQEDSDLAHTVRHYLG